jgi:Flp pilus assembly pilin Flp
MVGTGTDVRLIRHLGFSNRAATSIEYGLICSLIVVAIMVSLNMFAGKVVNMFSNVSSAVVSAG